MPKNNNKITRSTVQRLKNWNKMKSKDLVNDFVFQKATKCHKRKNGRVSLEKSISKRKIQQFLKDISSHKQQYIECLEYIKTKYPSRKQRNRLFYGEPIDCCKKCPELFHEKLNVEDDSHKLKDNPGKFSAVDFQDVNSKGISRELICNDYSEISFTTNSFENTNATNIFINEQKMSSEISFAHSPKNEASAYIPCEQNDYTERYVSEELFQNVKFRNGSLQNSVSSSLYQSTNNAEVSDDETHCVNYQGVLSQEECAENNICEQIYYEYSGNYVVGRCHSIDIANISKELNGNFHATYGDIFHQGQRTNFERSCNLSFSQDSSITNIPNELVDKNSHNNRCLVNVFQDENSTNTLRKEQRSNNSEIENNCTVQLHLGEDVITNIYPEKCINAVPRNCSSVSPKNENIMNVLHNELKDNFMSEDDVSNNFHEQKSKISGNIYPGFSSLYECVTGMSSNEQGNCSSSNNRATSQYRDVTIPVIYCKNLKNNSDKNVVRSSEGGSATNTSCQIKMNDFSESRRLLSNPVFCSQDGTVKKIPHKNFKSSKKKFTEFHSEDITDISFKEINNSLQYANTTDMPFKYCLVEKGQDGNVGISCEQNITSRNAFSEVLHGDDSIKDISKLKNNSESSAFYLQGMNDTVTHEKELKNNSYGHYSLHSLGDMRLGDTSNITVSCNSAKSAIPAGHSEDVCDTNIPCDEIKDNLVFPFERDENFTEILNEEVKDKIHPEVYFEDVVLTGSSHNYLDSNYSKTSCNMLLYKDKGTLDVSRKEISNSERSSVSNQDVSDTNISHEELKKILNYAAKSQEFQNSMNENNLVSEFSFSLESVSLNSNKSASQSSLNSSNSYMSKKFSEGNMNRENDSVSGTKNLSVQKCDKVTDQDINMQVINFSIENEKLPDGNKSIHLVTSDEGDKVKNRISNNVLKKKTMNVKQKSKDKSQTKRRQKTSYKKRFKSSDILQIKNEGAYNPTSPINLDIQGHVTENSLLENTSPVLLENSLPENTSPVLLENSVTKYHSKRLYRNVSRNDFILHLLKWKVNWLQIQMETKSYPPIFDQYIDVKESYQSMKEYYKTYFPLHLFNIWLQLYNSWRETPDIAHYDAKFETLEEKYNCMKISCSSIMTSKEFENFPEQSCVIIVTFAKMHNRREKVFGYVCEVTKEPYHLRHCPRFFKKITWEKVVFSFYTTEKLNECTQEFVKIQKLCNIEILLKQNDALLSLETSAMKDLILNPKSYASKIQIVSCSFCPFVKLQESVDKIIHHVSSPCNQILLVNIPPSDCLFAIFKLVRDIMEKNLAVLVCFKDEKKLLTLASYLTDYGFILAVKNSEISLPVSLKKFMVCELAAAKLNDGSLGERAYIEIFKENNVILTLSSSIYLTEFPKDFFDYNSTCIFDDADLSFETETAPLFTYNFRNIVLVSTSRKETIHPILKSYGYDKSFSSRLYRAKFSV